MTVHLKKISNNQWALRKLTAEPKACDTRSVIGWRHWDSIALKNNVLQLLCLFVLWQTSAHTNLRTNIQFPADGTFIQQNTAHGTKFIIFYINTYAIHRLNMYNFIINFLFILTFKGIVYVEMILRPQNIYIYIYISIYISYMYIQNPS